MFSFEPFRHLSYLSRLRARLPRPLLYNLSDSTAATLSVQQLLAFEPNHESHLGQLNLHYATVAGDEALRAAIIDLHQPLQPIASVNASNAAVFCGAQEAIFCTFNALLRPADEVITITPCYPSLLTVPKQLGAKVHQIPLNFADQWQLSFAAIKAKISSKTRLIVLNSPHNPTGAVFDQSLMANIISLARQQGIYILADDVSRWTTFNSTDPIDSAACSAASTDNLLGYEKAICIGVLSKSFGMAGIRIGWAVSQDHALIKRLLEIKGYLSICPSVMDEYLAKLVLNNQDTIISRNNHIVATNVAMFAAFIDGCQGAFSWQPPKAGLLTLVQSHLTTSVSLFAEQLAMQQQLLILPGELFYGPVNTFRLGLGQPDFATALAQFADSKLIKQ